MTTLIKNMSKMLKFCLAIMLQLDLIFSRQPQVCIWHVVYIFRMQRYIQFSSI